MDIIVNMFGMLFKLFFMVQQVLLVVIAPFVLSTLFFFIFYWCKGKRFKKRTIPRVSEKYIKPGFTLKRLLIDFPRRFVLDRYERDPDVFDIYGVHMFCGEQGSGKSIAMIHFIKMIKERNPACKIASNINIDFQNDVINDWTDILTYNNDEKGQVIILDEIQNWFSSNDSKNFPPEMLTEVTQQRKQRKIIAGTSQVFTRMSKPIREQITFLYKPFTCFGCITFVRVYRCKLTDEGTIDNMRMDHMYFFVHDEELRNCYNTFDKVNRMALVGFQERSAQLSNDQGVTMPDINKLKELVNKK